MGLVIKKALLAEMDQGPKTAQEADFANLNLC